MIYSLKNPQNLLLLLFPKYKFSKVHSYEENISNNIPSDAKTNYELNFIWIVLFQLDLKSQSGNLSQFIQFHLKTLLNM